MQKKLIKQESKKKSIFKISNAQNKPQEASTWTQMLQLYLFCFCEALSPLLKVNQLTEEEFSE